MIDHLKRDLAPVTSEAWDRIDAEAKRSLSNYVAARSLVDFTGPLGWCESAYPVGAVVAGSGEHEDVDIDIRVVQPFIELRRPFEVPLAALTMIDRGGEPGLDSVTEAARLIAEAENRAVVHGYLPAGISGIVEASPHESIAIGDDYSDYPRLVARAVATLRAAGVDGPYGIALGPRCYTGVVETTEEGGFPLIEHLKLILGGPVVWAPAIDGAAVVSLRGGDYKFVSGLDFAVGYSAHTAKAVELYLIETFTFVVQDASAAVGLDYG